MLMAAEMGMAEGAREGGSNPKWWTERDGEVGEGR